MSVGAARVLVWGGAAEGLPAVLTRRFPQMVPRPVSRPPTWLVGFQEDEVLVEGDVGGRPPLLHLRREVEGGHGDPSLRVPHRTLKCRLLEECATLRHALSLSLPRHSLLGRGQRCLPAAGNSLR